jgi:hypothetical protein
MTEKSKSDAPGAGAVSGVGGAIPANVSSSPDYEVRVEVIYNYKPEDAAPCVATVYVYIQCEQGSHKLPKLLTSGKTEFMDSILIPLWGVDKEIDGVTYRWNYIVFEDESWANLEERVKRFIEKVKNTLIIVKEENLAKLRSKPHDFIVTLKI